jgi:hypothetical protein
MPVLVLAGTSVAPLSFALTAAVSDWAMLLLAPVKRLIASKLVLQRVRIWIMEAPVGKSYSLLGKDWIT